MQIVDIIIILATLVSVAIGWYRGLVKESISIATLLIAIWAAMRLGPYAGGWLGGTIDSTELQMWAGRFLVFVVILACGAFLGWGISKIVHLAGLSGTDRALGGFFGLVRAVLLVGLFVLGGRYAGFDANLWWLNSRIIPYGEYVADWIIKMAPRGVEMLQPENLPEDFRLELPKLGAWQAVEKGSGECETRREAAKPLSPVRGLRGIRVSCTSKRSVYAINEHFEPIRNDVSRRLSFFSTPCQTA